MFHRKLHNEIKEATKETKESYTEKEDQRSIKVTLLTMSRNN
jgi:hypothetical protein